MNKRGPKNQFALDLAASQQPAVAYSASPTLSRFHMSETFHRLVIGPVGSGKSTACTVELFRRACGQAPSRRTNVRESRWAVIRNSYRELSDTTLKTFMDWLRPVPGEFNTASFAHRISFPLPDGTQVQAEFLFRALDRPEDVKKLLSLEITGAWVNEAREVPKEIVDILGDRAERFPPQRSGGCTFSGIILDTNPPDNEHWIYQLAERDRPSNWAVFKQPPGLIELPGNRFEPNPAAENLANLPPDYYATRAQGKSLEHIRVYYCNQYGYIAEGKPVIPEYNDHIHARDTLQPNPRLPLYIGLDFGLTPSATIAQRSLQGRWSFLEELCSDHVGILRFGNALLAKLGQDYPGYQPIFYGDPAGDHEAQTDERTVFDILRQLGIPAEPTCTNDWLVRRESLASLMTRIVDGEPAFLLSREGCPMLRRGLMGGYCYRMIYSGGNSHYSVTPNKSKFSHPVDAAMYACLGAGEGRHVSDGMQPLLDEGTIMALIAKPVPDPETFAQSEAQRLGGLYIDPKSSRSVYVELLKRSLVTVAELSTSDPKHVADWVRKQAVKQRKLPVITVNMDGTGAKVAQAIRDEGIQANSVNLNASGHQFKTTGDSMAYDLKQFLEHPDANISLSPKMVNSLWSSSYTVGGKGLSTVTVSTELRALSLICGKAHTQQHQQTSFTTKRLPSPFVR